MEVLRYEVPLERVVDCPFSAAQEYTEDFLSVLAAAGGLRFAARPDLTNRGKPHDELVVVWWRTGSQLLGDVEMTIRFRICALSTRVLLQASCHPAEADGASGDDAVTRVLRAAAGDLLERLARDAEQRERHYRLEHPPALGLVPRPDPVPA